MEDNNKSKEQLIQEISELRQKVKLLENAGKEQEKAKVKSFDSNNILQLIFDSISHGIYWKDINQTFLGCNKKFAEDVNYSCPDQVIGKTNNELNLDFIGNLYIEEDKLVIENDSPKLNFKVQHTKPDGTKIWLILNKYPIHDENGNVIGMLGSYEDISERKRREEKLEQERILLRTLINNIPDAIFAKDNEGRKIIANLADINNMGCETEEDAIGKTDFDFFTKETAQGFYANDCSVINTGNPILNREESFIDKNGKTHWLHTSKLPLKDDNGVYYRFNRNWT